MTYLNNRHKVFISFHHANDENYKIRFESLMTHYEDGMISKSVQDGDIDTNLPTVTIRQKIRDNYLRDSTVTVVLIGSETWKRKHIDWEISSSLRNTKLNSRSGLIGIILPTHPDYDKSYYTPGIIPPRVHNNAVCGFAKIYHWSESVFEVQQWIHEAFLRRQTVEPDNSYPNYVNNRPSYSTSWK